MAVSEEQYKRVLESIYSRFPSFQNVGGTAYKPGLERMTSIAEFLGNPQKRFRSIHIAGTNGKGSTSHMLASALMAKGYRTALFTSPHLWDFRERIKVSDGNVMKMVDKEFVYDFLCSNSRIFDSLGLSFFEITTAMAFQYFAKCNADIAVIECGLGGRLDSTNIITPELSIITNIGFDHCEYLGNTLPQIASEKAGIIKEGVPVVIGEAGTPDVRRVFTERAAQLGSSISFAERLENLPLSPSCMDLPGDCQKKNIRNLFAALDALGESVTDEVLHNIRHTASITGLHGRWEHLYANRSGELFFSSDEAGETADVEIICDTGHNAHGFAVSAPQLKECAKGRRLVMIFGCVSDKDLDSVMPLLPQDAWYLFANAAGTRAMPSSLLAERMRAYGLRGEAVLPDETGGSSVMKAVRYYFRNLHQPGDLLFIGGSSYVVASLELQLSSGKI